MNMLKKLNPTIIEIKKDATEKQIKLLKAMNPNSLIFKENSSILKYIYSMINSGIDVRNIVKNKISNENECYSTTEINFKINMNNSNNEFSLNLNNINQEKCEAA